MDGVNGAMMCSDFNIEEEMRRMNLNFDERSTRIRYLKMFSTKGPKKRGDMDGVNGAMMGSKLNIEEEMRRLNLEAEMRRLELKFEMGSRYLKMFSTKGPKKKKIGVIVHHRGEEDFQKLQLLTLTKIEHHNVGTSTVKKKKLSTKAKRIKREQDALALKMKKERDKIEQEQKAADEHSKQRAMYLEKYAGHISKYNADHPIIEVASYNEEPKCFFKVGCGVTRFAPSYAVNFPSLYQEYVHYAELGLRQYKNKENKNVDFVVVGVQELAISLETCYTIHWIKFTAMPMVEHNEDDDGPAIEQFKVCVFVCDCEEEDADWVEEEFIKEKIKVDYCVIHRCICLSEECSKKNL